MYRYRSFSVLLLIVLVMPTLSTAAPKADLWDYWLTHDEQSKQTVDHSAWDRFLKAYVTAGSDGVNRVAYGKVNGTDRQALADYIKMLGKTPVSRLNRAEQQSLWINLYNALTVQVIIDHYPVDQPRIQVWNFSSQPNTFSGLWAFFHSPAAYLLASARVG